LEASKDCKIKKKVHNCHQLCIFFVFFLLISRKICNFAGYFMDWVEKRAEDEPIL